MEFWNGWQLWEKMVFILACLIAITFLYALIVRIRRRRKLARDTVALAVSKAEQGRVSEQEKGHETPFGIRCLEKGVNVEGVWSSNANTPLQSPQSSAPSSPRLAPSPASASTSKKPSQGHRKSLSDTRARLQKTKSTKADSRQKGKAVDYNPTEFPEQDLRWVRNIATLDMRKVQKSPDLEAMRGKPAYQPHSSRYGHRRVGGASEQNTNVRRTSERPLSIPAAESARIRLPKRSYSDLGGSSSSVFRRQLNSSTEDFPISASSPPATFSEMFNEPTRFSAPHQSPIPVDAAWKKHVPEISQIPPLSFSNESESPYIPSLDITNYEHSEAHRAGRDASWPLPVENPQKQNPIQVPTSASLANAVPFRVFVERNPLPASRNDYADNNTRSSGETADANKQTQDNFHEGQHTSMRLTNYRARRFSEPAHDALIHRNTQTRRINAGFEILPAGTFSQANTANELRIDNRNNDNATEGKRQPRRLRRKNRLRGESQ